MRGPDGPADGYRIDETWWQRADERVGRLGVIGAVHKRWEALALVAEMAQRYLGVMVNRRKRGAGFRIGLVANRSTAPGAEARARKPRTANRQGHLEVHGERLTLNMQWICEDVVAGRLEDVTGLSAEDLMARVLRR